MKPLKVVQNAGVLYIFTCKCASRYSGVQFFDLTTSKSGPYPSVFWHFDLETCFALQRRAIFQHRNFKKWSAHEVFYTFWFKNVLLATAACNFSTSELQKAVRECCALYILTWKCASHYNGVQFFISPFNSYRRTRRFTEVTFRPSRPINHWKIQHFATSLIFRPRGFFCTDFRAIVFSFFWLYFSSLFFSSFDFATLLCFFNCPYCRKLGF